MRLRRDAADARRRPRRQSDVHVDRRPAALPARRRRRAVPGRHRRRRDPRPDDRARAPRGGVPRVLRRRRGDAAAGPDDRGPASRRRPRAREPRPLRPHLAGLPHACADRRGRAGRVGHVPAVIYDAFGSAVQGHLRQRRSSRRSSPSSAAATSSRLSGSVALGFIHPIAVGLNLVFAVGFAAAAIAGERQRGTLEVLLVAADLAARRCTRRWPRAARCSSASRSPAPIAGLARRGGR